MALSRDVVENIEYGLLGLAGLTAAFYLYWAAKVLPCCNQKSGANRDFNSLWRTRLVLEVAGAAWVLLFVLRLQVVWGPEGFLGLDGDTPSVLCRLSINLGIGLFQPLFLIMAVMSCRQSLRRSLYKDDLEGDANHMVLIRSLLWTAPCTAAFTVAAWLTAWFGSGWTDKSEWMQKLFQPWFVGSGSMCRDGGAVVMDGAQQGDAPTCDLCIFPGISTILQLLLAAMLALYMLHVSESMKNLVVSLVLRRRIVALQVTFVGGLIASVVVQALSLVADPHDVLFEALRIANLLTAVLILSSVSWILVVLPLHGMRVADKALLLPPLPLPPSPRNLI